ncbi:DNA-protecting protein DprA [Modestobacter sp. I12A-02628]|uniref:DNA-protecting protein DprA n=1 Tax=Goekera deserti TaxID=2497753 RepID=A0A7K3WIQ0_9ACTN|nr:DNA-protecting protein DprA [Goekera deserti]NDI50231.1 DNA-protecting protein DprA [Goekera deserti]NEL55799.1 DNA-protecting protein DprA [Goekera deserti]
MRAGAAVRRARAWLSRLVEPCTLDVWRYVADVGPVDAVCALREGRAPTRVTALAGARVADDQSLADLRRAERCGARLVVPEDDEWPALSLHCLELAVLREPVAPLPQRDRTLQLVPPLALWVRGRPRLDHLVQRSVALVGSRASTGYGEHVATDLGYGLGERGWTTVSGGAFGIDAASHRGALAAGVPTVVVLACGVDRVYPVAHSALFARVLQDGLLVSEWPPGCAPLRHRFLVRNRLIAGLTQGTVVIEAAARSGAQATANRAADLGRQVMAVPGPVTSAMSVGCHELLRDATKRVALVATAAQVVETVGAIGSDLAAPPERPQTPRDDLSDIARRVLDACPVRTGVPPERLAAVAGCDVLDVLRVLPALELAELVEWTGSGWRVTHAATGGAAR